jgi:hypothetical protein
MNGDVRCGSKPARWRYGVFFTKEWMRNEIPEEPARRGSHTSNSLFLDGPTENMDASSPARKAHAQEIHEKAGSISNTCELPWPARDDIKKRLPTSRCGGEPPPCAASSYPDARIMAAARCSPAVAYRRAKYDGDFRVPALLSAHPLDHTARASPTRHAQYRHRSRT